MFVDSGGQLELVLCVDVADILCGGLDVVGRGFDVSADVVVSVAE